jgi:hypothetical protein
MNWCRRGESNPRPRDYETLALPLSYAGLRQLFMLRIRLRECQGVVLGNPIADPQLRPRPVSQIRSLRVNHIDRLQREERLMHAFPRDFEAPYVPRKA